MLAFKRLTSAAAAVALFLALAAASAAAQATPLRFVAFGDSIGASGFGSPNGCGYRTELDRLLTTPAANVAPVWTGPIPHTGPNDCQLGRRFGSTLADVRAQVAAAMADDPDVAIVMVGTNNAAGGAAGLATFGPDYRALVTELYAAKPTVRVIVTWLTYSSAAWAGWEVTANSLIYQYVWGDQSTAITRQATFLNLAQYPTRLKLDGIHPSNYDMIGRVLYDVIAPWYGLPPGPHFADAWVIGDCRPGIERAPRAISC